MIRSIDSSHPGFKKIEFRKGFNVVLAERAKGSSQRDSRNGLGKSTMINIIHFCLGAEPRHALANAVLRDSEFTLELDLGRKTYRISRSPGNKTRIFIDGDCSSWPVKPAFDRDTKRNYLGKNAWLDVLGKLMFDLGIGQGQFHPTFRSLISYFIRRREGFLDPFRQTPIQQTWDMQANNAYLLNLGWDFAVRLQILRQKKYDLDAFKREITTGKFSGIIGDPGELKAERIRLQLEMERQKDILDRFEVNEQYDEIEKEANRITDEMHDLANSNVADTQRLEQYNASIKEEDEYDKTDTDTISKIYRESGVYFSEKITNTLERVVDFHNKIIKNRRDFLDLEIARLAENIEKRRRGIKQLDARKAEMLQILNTQGALKEYTSIQKNFVGSQDRLNAVTAKLEQIQDIEDRSNQIKLDRQKLYHDAMIDMGERSEQMNDVIATFGRFSSLLYNEFGRLLINMDVNGFRFGIDIPRSSSQGIGNMKVFCYDLTLAKIWSKRDTAPGFLIHDSVVYDGVDERQRAGALRLAKDVSDSEGFQYICAMNSDMVPRRELGRDFDLDGHVVRKLSDATEDGGLLGIRIREGQA